MHVDVDLAVGDEVGLLEERAELHDPRVVDEHVERAEIRLDAVDERLEGGPVGDVERVALRVRAELRRRGLRGREIEVADRDLHPLAEKVAGGLLADAARAAGDRGDLAGEDAGGLLGHGNGS